MVKGTHYDQTSRHQFGQWLTVQCGHMVRDIHHDQSRTYVLQFGQWLTVRCARMVKGIHHDQASCMCSSSTAQFGRMVKDIQHDQGSPMCAI